ncbi:MULTISPECIES: DUF2768 domain-containing protein [Allobacillus]|uniref:DUF2768 domain-containing protein n=1 Tax=Allobacillus salarius TaxID=1955272 RepID=A0A556PT53_9BACI|nr:DUF2768 domain-containing protein [Allobacillus salarius]TSJ67570.1 DUF2768 domain-containing protein [Allobacillus salarius]
MSQSMLNMYISFGGMILLFAATGLIILARNKLSGVLRFIVSLTAYLCLVVGAIIIFYIVLSGPTE